MHSVFVTELMDWKTHYPSRTVRFVNALLERLGIETQLVSPGCTGSMTNTEQRMNLFHLVSQVLAHGVPGDLVELGTHVGQTGVLFGKVVEAYAPERRLHVYDVFKDLSSEDHLRDNFKSIGLRVPEIHVGWIEQSVPEQLPEEICFAHIDLGSPICPDLSALVLYCLEHVYPRLQTGGICVLNDYCDPSILDSLDPWPAIKAASDEFFCDKPEDVWVRYAGYYSHGFVRKQ